jgi:hypothetical protein
MTKEIFINKILCEHWYCLGSWSKGRQWDDRTKQVWLSGMHRAWNIISPENKIEPLEIVRKVTTWSRAEAQQWYTDYLSEREEDDDCIENRWDILDFHKPL